mmetsp:Transcript_20328/g.24909  ORF Transcript_20328/g.24909 Transcript_20328/m.24909 type:complete len:292 (+) Transcript_20328:161-1036(+)
MCDDGFCCFQCIRTKEIGVIENLGQYKRLAGPGLSCILYPLESIVGKLSLRIQQIDVRCETKTKDNVFVQIGVAVQFRVIEESAYDAYYRLENPSGQIQSYVFDVVRSTLPRMELDDAFANKDQIAAAIFEQLQDVMRDYGYEILASLLVDISPDAKVKVSMNEINASKRLKAAAEHKAEADKIRQVKAAEADAEAKYLSGMGVARQRKAIAEGLQNSVFDFSQEIHGSSPKDVMDIILLTQYFDTLDNVGADSLILEHDPQVVGSLQRQLRTSTAANRSATVAENKNSFF